MGRKRNMNLVSCVTDEIDKEEQWGLHMRQGKPSIIANVPTGPPNSHLYEHEYMCHLVSSSSSTRYEAAAVVADLETHSS